MLSIGFFLVKQSHFLSPYNPLWLSKNRWQPELFIKIQAIYSHATRSVLNIIAIKINIL